MSLPLLVLAALAGLYLQGQWYKRRGLARLRYERRFDRAFAYEGDEAEMLERIANDKATPLPWLRLEALMSSGLRFVRQENLSIASGERLQNHRSLFSLWGYTEIVRRHKVRCVRRGCYDLDTVTMSCGDLFGTAQAVRTERVNARLLVYPRPAPVGELPLPWRGWQGDYAVRRWTIEDPFLTQGIREYRPGDPMKSIHWKAVSRTRELQVREMGHTADRRIMVLLNAALTEDMWGDVSDEPRMEWAIRCVLTLLEQGVSDGLPMGFGTNMGTVDEPARSVRVPPGSGSLQLKEILDAMAKLQLVQVVPLEELLRQEAERLEPAADYVLVTAFVNGKLRERIAALEERGSRVEVLPLGMPPAAAQPVEGRAVREEREEALA